MQGPLPDNRQHSQQTHPCPGRIQTPQFQQAKAGRPKPSTAQPLGSAPITVLIFIHPFDSTRAHSSALASHAIFITYVVISFTTLYHAPYIVQIAYPSSCDVKLLVTAFTVSHLLVWCPLSIPLCNIPCCFLLEVCYLKLWYFQLITKFFQCLFMFHALFLQLVVIFLQRHIFLPRDFHHEKEYLLHT